MAPPKAVGSDDQKQDHIHRRRWRGLRGADALGRRTDPADHAELRLRALLGRSADPRQHHPAAISFAAGGTAADRFRQHARGGRPHLPRRDADRFDRRHPRAARRGSARRGRRQDRHRPFHLPGRKQVDAARRTQGARRTADAGLGQLAVRVRPPGHRRRAAHASRALPRQRQAGQLLLRPRGRAFPALHFRHGVRHEPRGSPGNRRGTARGAAPLRLDRPAAMAAR